MSQASVATTNSQAEARVEVTVAYLPAAHPFTKRYDDETAVAMVRSESMAFFHVQDHRDRDLHEFFLEFEGHRVTDVGQTLEHLFDKDQREARFHLVEQITPGADR